VITGNAGDFRNRSIGRVVHYDGLWKTDTRELGERFDRADPERLEVGALTRASDEDASVRRKSAQELHAYTPVPFTDREARCARRFKRSVVSR